MNNLSRYWKAILAFFTPGLLLLASAWMDGSLRDATAETLIEALVTASVTSFLVYVKANTTNNRVVADQESVVLTTRSNY